jgi:hypothetical protein
VEPQNASKTRIRNIERLSPDERLRDRASGDGPGVTTPAPSATGCQPRPLPVGLIPHAERAYQISGSSKRSVTGESAVAEVPFAERAAGEA